MSPAPRSSLLAAHSGAIGQMAGKKLGWRAPRQVAEVPVESPGCRRASTGSVIGAGGDRQDSADRLDSHPLCSPMNSIISAVAGRAPARRKRSRPEDVVGAAKLLDLALEVAQALALIGRESGAASGVALLPADPLAKGFSIEIGFLGDRADRCPLRGVLMFVIEYEPHCSLSYLWRYLRVFGMAPSSQDQEPPLKPWRFKAGSEPRQSIGPNALMRSMTSS